MPAIIPGVAPISKLRGTDSSAFSRAMSASRMRVAIPAQMRGDPVGFRLDRQQRGAHRVRAAPSRGKQDGGDVVDVDAQTEFFCAIALQLLGPPHRPRANRFTADRGEFRRQLVGFVIRMSSVARLTRSTPMSALPLESIRQGGADQIAGTIAAMHSRELVLVVMSSTISTAPAAPEAAPKLKIAVDALDEDRLGAEPAGRLVTRHDAADGGGLIKTLKTSGFYI